ncbi:benzoate-CoA ligase family protein [Reyranella aquatilis]|uniref:Benzoate-CoA ligase family protein n=1 Tax=Reyranella aquatilis TaxID=2035356 RepID=A0ABS8KYY1_9HYPH|nr:benzoate-CoA ligase family protein [Reyranella aquatilis]MCC8431304.1 benzoate-CoA ligase family protein [Reyranella aquatilis]
MALPSGISFSPAHSVELSDRFNVAVPFIDRHVGEGRGAKAAIRTSTESVSYADLAERVSRAGNALLAAGLRPGDRLLMVVKDCPAFFYLFWGAIKAGIVPVPPNTLLRAPDYAYMFEDSGCRLVVYSPEFTGEIGPALEQLGARAPNALDVDGFLTAMAAASPALEARLAAPEDDCFWLYSSGSTGRPKGAVHAHRDMVVTSELYGVRVLGISETDVSYSAAKLFFAYGLGNGMTFPLWVGGTAILDDRRPTPETTFSNIETFRPTIYYGVPTLYAAQLAALETQKRDLSSLRACVSAGEALPADMFRRWKEQTGTTILDGIGSTEALHIFIGNRLDDCRPGTSGKPVPGYEARILDENGDPVARGESGRLWIKAESAAKYYWNKPEKTAETMVNGWLNTGDTYRQDEDGYFIYEGRSDDMLKVGGIWCSPVEIENCLVGHPAVLEAAVIGQTDEQSLIKPKAIVVLKQPGDAGAAMTDALMAHCKRTLAPYKYPRWIEYVPELPKTATGKIQRFRLRA